MANSPGISTASMARAFSMSPPSTIAFTLANAARAQSGLPVCVLVIDPAGNWSMISVRPITAPSGSELLIPLPQQMTSGTTP